MLGFEAIETVWERRSVNWKQWGDTWVQGPDIVREVSAWVIYPPPREILRWWIMAVWKELPPNLLEVRFHPRLPRGGRFDVKHMGRHEIIRVYDYDDRSIF